MVEQRLGFFDAGEGKVMGLDDVGMVSGKTQFQGGGAQEADDDDGQKDEAPEQADED
jgi:hypothetical protein